METKKRLWKLNDINQWELFNQVEDVDVRPTSLATSNQKETASPEKSGTKASSQLFYIQKMKQEVKGATIYTPKGYGVIQNIMPEKNMITVKVNNEIIDFERSEVSNDISIQFIHVQAGEKRTEWISFPIQSTAKDINDRINSQYQDPSIIARLFFKGKELEPSNDTLEKLGITHGSKILAMTKPGKSYSVNRFKQVSSGWGYGPTTFDSISFSASKDIRISGVGIYGPSQQNYTLAGTVKLIQGPSSDGDIAATTTVEVNFSVHEKIHRVMFSKPISVRAEEVWSICAELSLTCNSAGGFGFGSGSHYGNNGLTICQGEGDVTFAFLTCPRGIKTNQTTTYSGQIPEIYYYT